MEKSKLYYNCKFSVSTIKEAHDYFLTLLDTSKNSSAPCSLTITKANETWKYDTFEEFISAYNSADNYWLDHINIEQKKRITIHGDKKTSYISIQSINRKEIEGIFLIFESKLSESTIKIKDKPIKIFIGHGQNDQWRDLKDHLHEKHGIEVVAYEIGPRAGLSIKEVLESMLKESSFALLVLTGEDTDSEGQSHARENVIHELGLFQGKIGFKRAIAMLEKDVNEFSNIFGVNQVRFSKGNIKETFGEIISIIKREFEQDDK